MSDIVQFLVLIGALVGVIWAVMAVYRKVGTDRIRQIDKAQRERFWAHKDEPISEKREGPPTDQNDADRKP